MVGSSQVVPTLVPLQAAGTDTDMNSSSQEASSAQHFALRQYHKLCDFVSHLTIDFCVPVYRC